MANAQLVAYVKEQYSHKADERQLRTLLLQQGWPADDVEEALHEARGLSMRQDKEQHHTHFLQISIAAAVVVILAVALFVTVFSNPGPVTPTPLPVTPPATSPPTQTLTGAALCATHTDSAAKDACYYDLVAEKDDFDCDSLDASERTVCNRARDVVILENYA
jgi:hypothetical protein